MISIRSYKDKNTLVIEVADKFDFTAEKVFSSSYEKIIGLVESVTIDLSKVEFMDSVALAMLWNLREKFGGDAADITLLVKDNKLIRKILEITHAHKKFKVI